MYAQMLVGMVGMTGQWWLDARRPAKDVAASLGIHNVEVWNAHFDNESLGYCVQHKAAAAKVGSITVAA